MKVFDGLSARGEKWLESVINDSEARREALSEFRDIMEQGGDIRDLALCRNPEWVLLHTYLLLKEIAELEKCQS